MLRTLPDPYIPAEGRERKDPVVNETTVFHEQIAALHDQAEQARAAGDEQTARQIWEAILQIDESDLRARQLLDRSTEGGLSLDVDASEPAPVMDPGGGPPAGDGPGGGFDLDLDLDLDLELDPPEKTGEETTTVQDLFMAAEELDGDVGRYDEPPPPEAVLAAPSGPEVVPDRHDAFGVPSGEAEELVIRARQALDSGELQEASQYASQALALCETVTGAEEVLEEARRRGEKRGADADRLLGEAWEDLDGGRVHEALSRLEAALELVPGHPEILEQLDRARTLAGAEAAAGQAGGPDPDEEPDWSSMASIPLANRSPVGTPGGEESEDAPPSVAAAPEYAPFDAGFGPPTGPAGPASTGPEGEAPPPPPVPETAGGEGVPEEAPPPLPQISPEAIPDLSGPVPEAKESRARPKRSARAAPGRQRQLLVLLVVVALGAGGWYGWQWWSGRDTGNPAQGAQTAGVPGDGGQAQEGKTGRKGATKDAAGKTGAGASAAGAADEEAEPRYTVKDVPALLGRAQALEERGDYRGALALLEAARQADPTSFEVVDRLETVRRLERERTDALERVRMACELFQGGSYREALRLFYRIPEPYRPRELHRWIADGWYNLGVQALQAGNLAEARRFFDDALELRPQDPEARQHQTLARRYERRGLDEVYWAYVGSLELRPLADVSGGTAASR